MAEANYAFVVGGNVTNIAVFDDPSTELLDHFKNEFSLDEIVPTGNDVKAAIGGTWDGTKFTLPKPYPSWVLNADNDWEAPVAYPEVDPENPKYYVWDESVTNWVEAPTE